MEERILKLAIGGLLHDVGKVLHRGEDVRNHSRSGYEFLKKEGRVEDIEILEQVLYHHGQQLSGATLAPDALAYVTYMADNIASGADRRTLEEGEWGFDRELPLSSIYNILKGNDEEKHYAPRMLSEEGSINFPEAKTDRFDRTFYSKVTQGLRDSLKGLTYTESYVNSLLELLEAYLSYVPSSTSRSERGDISLYDHMKLTAALGCSIELYLEDQGKKDYKEVLLQKSEKFYKEKAFLLYSLDMSGIQDFIYTVSSKGALKALRARSFYLEIMMEHIIDELFAVIGLSRANLLYSGGGHAYLLLPNTSSMEAALKNFESGINRWFMETFGTALFIAGGYAPCSAEALWNKPNGSFREIFLKAGDQLGRKKLQRYDAEAIQWLNQDLFEESERECAVCRRKDRLDETDKCSVCNGLESFSNEILHKDFFMVKKGEGKGRGLPLPHGCVLLACDDQTLVHSMENDAGYLRSYAKNRQYTGKSLATKLWVGDYLGSKTFEEMADQAQGISRIAVMRGDIDGLGETFVSGFEHPKYGERFVTISRNAAFSRSLSLFLKSHVNGILELGEFYLDPKREPGPRKISVVYSGGDDTFFVGSWDEVLGFAVDLYRKFSKFTQGTLTFSAGIGIYPEKYPVTALAKQTEELESAAKRWDGKNAIALFSDDQVYPWRVFIDEVLLEKFRSIQVFLEDAGERGMNFLYNLLHLLRNREERINLARYAYLLSRMEPSSDATTTEKDRYHRFSRSMYEWMKSEKDSHQVITALNLYSYLYRSREED